MFVLRSRTSTRSPWVAVTAGPGTCPLNAHADTFRPLGRVTVVVAAVSVNRRTVPPGSGVLGPRRARTEVPADALAAPPPPATARPQPTRISDSATAIATVSRRGAGGATTRTVTSVASAT